MSYFEFLQYPYLIATAIFLFSLLCATILNVVIRKATKDKTVMQILHKVVIFVIILGGVYFGLKALNLPENVWSYIERATQIILIIKIFQAVTLISDFFIQNYVGRGFDLQLTRLIKRIVSIALWVIGVSMILNIFGYDIGALIAGLGIGGLAIALAAQDTLGNFFSSLSIMADKPYKIGDVIKFGNYEGVIKDIGMRTTRIETFFGTIISVPNSELAKSVVENMSKRQSRRDDGAIGLVYNSTRQQIEQAIEIIKNILDKEENLTKDFRVFFTAYDPYSLRIEYTYHVKDPRDMDVFLRTKNKLNLEIKDRFDKAGLEMAFPTQTIQIQK